MFEGCPGQGRPEIKVASPYIRNVHEGLSLVWTRKKERKRLRLEKNFGDGGARKQEKRKAKEKVDGFFERSYGKGWS